MMDVVYSSKEYTWEDLNNFNNEEADYLITYLLYREGKNIDLISRIRNLPKDIVQEHILKLKMNQKKNDKKSDEKNDKKTDKISYHPSLINLLAADKNKRIKILAELKPKEKEGLALYLNKILPAIDNAEDKMIALWIAGQLKDERLLSVIRGEIEHKHGGVRRMVCSALGRIPHVDNMEVLHRGLQDGKPQVRQYAAKALLEIGDEKTLKRLKNLLNNPKELDYVKRSYIQTMEIIQKKL